MQVTSTDSKKEKEYIKEMNFIKESRPYIEEIDRYREIIFKKKGAQYDVKKGLKDLKEEAAELKSKIATIKKTLGDAQESKEQIQKSMDKINLDRNTAREHITELRGQKDVLREYFYKKQLGFEKQQILIKQIEFLTKIKERVIDNEKAKREWEEEKTQRQEERKKKIEEAEKREQDRRQKEEDYWREQDEAQKKWEDSQLQILDVHPYTYEIELCDFLFKYCQKQDQLLNGRLIENKLASNIQSRVAAQKAAMEQERRELEEKRKIAIEEALSKGKLARAEVNNEKAQRQQPVHTVAAPVKRAQPVADDEDQ